MMRHASRGTSCSSAAASACSSDVEAEDLGHGLRDGVRHVDEGEPRVARGVRRVERRVKDRDGEPPRVERAGQLQHRADVALERQREQHHARPPARTVRSSHSFRHRQAGCSRSRCVLLCYGMLEISVLQPPASSVSIYNINSGRHDPQITLVT